MSNIFSAMSAIAITFFACTSIWAQAHSNNDLYSEAYDVCIDETANELSDEGALTQMGFLQTPAEVNTFCGCAADVIVDAYYEDEDAIQTERKIEQGALQCMLPYIKPAVTDLCLTAATENDVANATQKCTCFGENVDVHAQNDVTAFFDAPDRYLDASAQYCRLDE